MQKKSLFVVAVALGCTYTAYGKTLVVNNNASNTSSPCKTAPYSSIFAAMANASTGDTIEVCPGTYNEAVQIDIPKLTLKGLVTNGSSLIQLMPSAGISIADANSSAEDPNENVVLLVDSVSGVTIDNISVNGSAASNNCGSGNAGIYFRNASGTVKNSAVSYIGLNPDGSLTGCQEGYGIYVDSYNASASLTVTNTTIHDFDKNGIAAREPGTTLVATGNTIVGSGPTKVTAQNGVELVYGSKGTINNNVISAVDYTPQSDAATGILFYQAADNSQANDNIISETNNGIDFYDTNKGKANGNNISRSFNWNALSATGNSTTFESNVITSAGIETNNPAIYLCGSKNVVEKNAINDAPSGVQDDRTTADGCSSASSNTVTMNTYVNVGTDSYKSTNNQGPIQEDLTPAHVRAQNVSRPKPRI